MTLSRRDARTEAVVRRSEEVRLRLAALAAELDAYVVALQAEIDRVHDGELHDEEPPHG